MDYQENLKDTKFELKKELSLHGVSFRYSPEGPDVLTDISYSICKGDRIGIVGTTGSGKSTLVDLIMGLLIPSEGEMTFDGEVLNKDNMGSWQNCIAHVPQSIYLTDGTIEQNIGFGCTTSEINSEWVVNAAKVAQLHDVVLSLPDQYKTRIGENGVLLSGGQRQRLGIARALYRKSSLIIFDEATSALDTDTEENVIDAIEALGNAPTVVMVAHRLSTLRSCNKLIRINNGNLEKINDFEELPK